MAPHIQESPFVKQLAASDKETRDKALASLKTFLSGQRRLEALELLKLWKGLFYCMWMTDKPLVQQTLASDLAGLVQILPAGNVLPFLEAFWTTMAREWHAIDRLRMDKFMLLVRGYLHASFRYLGAQGWRLGLVEQVLEMLSSIPLCGTGNQVPDGLRYHLMDVYVDEMDRVDTPRTGEMPVELLLEPLRRLMQESPTKAIRKQADRLLKDERLARWNDQMQASHVEEEEDDEVWEGIGD
ncbi:MAG: hypothetical protein M1826_005444 [Phylliscum demangeonii]|nr:MAG: hypothetical protein M1826_005444 [Phylliscum demangeonii]